MEGGNWLGFLHIAIDRTLGGGAGDAALAAIRRLWIGVGKKECWYQRLKREDGGDAVETMSMRPSVDRGGIITLHVSLL